MSIYIGQVGLILLFGVFAFIIAAFGGNALDALKTNCDELP